jgi:hypothetical protein
MIFRPLILVSTLLAASTAAWAQSPSVPALLRSGQAALVADDYARAAASFERSGKSHWTIWKPTGVLYCAISTFRKVVSRYNGGHPHLPTSLLQIQVWPVVLARCGKATERYEKR